MGGTFLHNHLESGLVPLSPESGQLCLQLGWKELWASVMESPAGQVRQDVFPTHRTWEQQGLPYHWVLPRFNEVKH